MNALTYFKELLIEATSETNTRDARESYHTSAAQYLQQEGTDILKEIEHLEYLIKGDVAMTKADLADAMAQSLHDLLNTQDPTCRVIDRQHAEKLLKRYYAVTLKMKAVA